ncbi:MAG: DNA polymerase III subunit alpha, partial [Chloroflexi bacterium]|nr:DNA polymerase III subunit alpha [Chloroflexota bacterium]
MADLGLPGIVGAEAHVALEGEPGAAGAGAVGQATPALVLLVESEAGYAALSRLLTRGQMAGAKGAPRLAWDDLAVAAEARGLVCLSGGWQGALVAALRAGNRALARRRAERLRDLFGPGRFWVELQHHRRPEDRRLIAELTELAEQLRLGVVATNGVLYADRAARPLQDVLTCIKHHTTLDGAGPLLKPNAEYGLKSPAEMAALFPHQPAAIRNTTLVAERCAFRLENVGYRFPAFPVPEGETPFSYLYALCQAGARQRYHPIEPRVSKQLAHELELIQKLGLAEYLLIVWDIMRFARERGILAQGRGSAANSVVAYVLGITNVDPIKLDLLFERFLSEERQGAPDIDVDFANKDREQVIQYVYERYGRAHAGMVCEVISYRPRSAIRDVGKALGLSLEEVDRLAKAVDRYGPIPEEDYPGANSVSRYGSEQDDGGSKNGRGPKDAREGPHGRDVQDGRDSRDGRGGGKGREGVGAGGRGALSPLRAVDPRLGPLVQQIQGFPRHLGIHVGGMIVTREPLEEVAPLERATMAGRTVIQWDKDDVEAMGLVKIDLLGLGMLSLLQDALKLVQEHEGHTIDLAALSFDDPEIYDMLCRADAVGLFQVESRAQMSTLPRLKPRTFYDLVIEISLIRPGPIQGGSVHPYLRRRAGLEPVTYPHPKLQPVLEKTLGVPLFQEQGMRLAIAAAGFSPGKADQLRRAMGHKRSRERMAELYDDFLQGMAANGIPERVGRQVWKQLSAFADYGFPESHAASFALIVYASAYLKRYYPVAFYCALLNNQPMGFYPPATIVGDVRRHGVRILPVDVQRSRADCTVEQGALRLGLRYVKGIGESV